MTTLPTSCEDRTMPRPSLPTPARGRTARHRTARLAALLTAAAAVVAALAGPAVAAVEDPDLDQTIDAGAAVVTGTRVLEAGHVDMGPRVVDGRWQFLVHDDVAKADANATSVWRYPDQTVLRVTDAAQLTVPDDPAYAFLGAAPGAPVWVVPQTQDPEVVWLGWNTQDPDVMATIDRGVTLSLSGVQGPGTVSVYLQSGSFGEPQVLWDSRVAEPQPVWVDVNTHTHANWVFTQPGVYLLRLTAEADLVDGTTASDTQVLRFAVGSATSTDEALAATWAGTEPSAEAADTDAPADEPVDGGAADASTDGTGAADVAGGDGGRGALVPVLVGAVVLVAVALVAGFVVAGVRGARARRRVLAAHAGGPTAGVTSGAADGGAA
ncbi:TIGR03773 family transporter-associated surface protein [Cellulomonas sp. NPDC057328]|uniref:TIGR03773 family transporter-associated surface protein n=1 Tax=Cellulomonas sp. NPDC057328 TaxID=3346101 RepID=UPI003637F4B8